MRFLMLYRPADQQKVEGGVVPCPREQEEMGQFIAESFRSGVLIATEGCLPTSQGARVRQGGGKVSVTDGPFTEAKELIAGFALVNADSRAHAVELAKAFLKVAGDGETEVRQVYEAPALAS